jgi:hypothetical protein
MRKLLTIVLLCTFTCSFCQTKQQLDSLTRVLEKIGVEDQKYRSVWDSMMQQYGINSPQFIELIKGMNYQDSINMLGVGNILDKFGWLSREQTSRDANDALFLVLQHATLPSQLKYLPVMKKAVADKKADPSAFAMLVDRTNMYQGKLQVYGSQLNYDGKGQFRVYPIIDEPNVDKRRKAAGLLPMQEYVKLISKDISYTLPKTDLYKNKIVLRGTVRDKNEYQPLADVSIYTSDGRFISKTDSSGFFQVLLNKTSKSLVIILKKKGFETLEFKPDATMKQVVDADPVLISK